MSNLTRKHDNAPIARYTIKKSAKIVGTDTGSFVLKKKKRNRDTSSQVNATFEYLQSRSFDYFPKLISSDDEYDTYEYIEEIKTPNEQKALDLISLTALLHSKTTYFKEVDMDFYQELYEKYLSEIDSLYNYYNSMMNIIDKTIYMAPREYLLARNSSKIFAALAFCKNNLEKWYEIIKESRKQRVVTVHKKLEVDHLLEREKPYLISWEDASNDMPIYDLYNFYQKHYLDFDFVELFGNYEKKYPLTKEEKMLLQILLALPKKIEFTDSMYNDCKEINKILEYLYKTELVLEPNTAKN